MLKILRLSVNKSARYLVPFESYSVFTRSTVEKRNTEAENVTLYKAFKNYLGHVTVTLSILLRILNNLQIIYYQRSKKKSIGR